MIDGWISGVSHWRRFDLPVLPVLLANGGSMESWMRVVSTHSISTHEGLLDLGVTVGRRS